MKTIITIILAPILFIDRELAEKFDVDFVLTDDDIQGFLTVAGIFAVLFIVYAANGVFASWR